MRDIIEYQKEYIKSDFEQSYQVRYRRKKVVELVEKEKHQSILEIGCGMDTIASYISGFNNFTIVEPGKAFIEKAQSDMQENERVNFVNGYFEEELDEVKRHTYDFVIVSSLLHEVENPLELLLAVKTICTPQTIVHVNVPNALSLHRILAYEAGMIGSLEDKSGRNVALQQNKIFDMNSLETLLRSTGEIEICEKGSYFVKPFSHKQLEDCLGYGIIDENILDAFYKLTKYMPEYGSEIYMNFRYIK